MQTTRTIFQINNTKLYVPVVTLSTIDNIKFSENIKQGLKWTIYWNKYRSEITTKPKSNNWDYQTDLTFTNIDRLFLLSFKNDNGDPKKNSVDEYYISLVDIEYFNTSINNKLFFDRKCFKNLLKCQKMITKQQEIH